MAPPPGVAGTVVYSILDKAIQFFQEPVNRKRIQIQCIDPLLHHILDIMFPYIILTCILFSLILLMSCTSIGLLVYQLRTVSSFTSHASILPSVPPNIAAPIG